MQYSFEDILRESKQAPDGSTSNKTIDTSITSCDSSFELEKSSFSKELDLKAIETKEPTNSVCINGKARLDVFLSIEEESSDLDIKMHEPIEPLTCRSMKTELSYFGKNIGSTISTPYGVGIDFDSWSESSFEITEFAE